MDNNEAIDQIRFLLYVDESDGFTRREKEALNMAISVLSEVRQDGRWILCEDQHGVDNDNNNYAYFCSQCRCQDVHSKYAKVNFCWNCGCKMQDSDD